MWRMVVNWEQLISCRLKNFFESVRETMCNCNVHYYCALVRSRRPPKKCEVRWRNEERSECPT